MSEQILTEDEKKALLDGVSSGAVEVHSGNGTRYKSVRPYRINPRSRIVSRSYPRLQAINSQLALNLERQSAALLQCELEVASSGTDASVWSEYGLGLERPCIAALFAAAPLAGQGLLVLPAALVAQLVEAFFGGAGTPPAGNSTAFTAGELNVATLFCKRVLEAAAAAWEPLQKLEFSLAGTETNLDLLEVAGDSELVLGSSFDMAIGGQRGSFRFVWPQRMLGALLPTLEGSKRERNAASDAEWERAMCARLADVPMRVAARVGTGTRSLGEVVRLVPGDVVPIGNPRAATVVANDVPVLSGRFGLCAGQNAVEAVTWLRRTHTPSTRAKEKANG